ncbi:GmrSD restriction endonuclease domain-containing protein [Variovorax sp. RB3P1]|uniref:GmrSD restriction endonuclease domain-containing protein n=1 Tax=Variovorax sp. RB3P1 TaxID=3443732 RepID=UPI003F46AFCE
MKATEANLLKFLRKSPQFVIPIYQRNYSWTAAQCRQLWADLMRAGRDEKISAHFIGSIVYVERGLSTVTSQEALLVIDGQQRLTTSTLFIAALAKHFETQGLGELLEAFSNKKLRNYYLLNPDEEGERHFKLILSETDKDTLLSLLQSTPMPAEASSRITENYALFQELIAANQGELEAICQGLAKLVIVDVSLDRAQDNPQLIFESMNSTGLELSQADLIRNYILMGLEPKLQTELYKTYWRPMEKAFGQAAYVVHFDAFMRHYLTAKTGEIPNVREVYVAFKAFARSLKGDTRDLVADIHAYASYYCAMALGTEVDAGLKQAFHDLRELKVDVAYPFLLDVYHDYKRGRLTSDEVLRIVRLIESYVFRRAICAIPTNSLNKTFAGMSRTLKKDRYFESVQAAFLMLPSYRRFPSDDEFQRDVKVRDLYNFRSRGYWLRRLENHGRKERVMVEDYTIEHILPQNEALSKEWQTELGTEWQRVQQDWLHTLGNLTLTGYNSEYSDRPFAYKRDQVTDKDGNLVGFAHSPLKLNLGLGKVNTWDEVAIKTRADRLALDSAKVWGAPQLADDVLDAYRPAAAKPVQQYSVADHPHLAAGPMRELFEALRKSVSALDPCVSEEFLKLYVAFKAETNFVDVVPQARRLLLVLNLGIADIEDPKGLCRDISSIGRWGNGDVEIGLSSVDELPYVMGLIRQSFDRQMGAPQDA